MNPNDLQNRTKEFALRVMKLSSFLEKDSLGRLIGRQIFRSGTSVAANYRAACKSKSVKDFISKLGIVVEEADETSFWLELLKDSETIQGDKIDALLQEAKEITAIMVASRSSAIKNQRAK
ncbi:MAG: four helix bundle protein [Patescibacteria group bacterium]